MCESEIPGIFRCGFSFPFVPLEEILHAEYGCMVKPEAMVQEVFDLLRSFG